MKSLTIIVPCFNEEACIPLFYNEVSAVMKDRNIAWHILFVDDGSSDRTLPKIRALSEKDGHVAYLSFSRNFDKEAAMLAGLEQVRTDLAVCMDADLQHPCGLLPQMLEILEDPSVHIAGAKRKGRQDQSFLRRIGSILYARFSGCTDGATDFRMMDQMAIKALLSCRESDRYLKGLFDHIGFSTRWIEYENVERQAGKTKWNIKSLVSYALRDLLISETFIKTVFGFVFALLACSTLVAMIQKNMSLVLLLLAFTMQTSLLLLLSLLLQKVLIETKHRPLYFIEESGISADHAPSRNTSSL